MAAALTVVVVVLLSVLVIRVAAIALKLTGMSSEAARFQARSAFLGVGFTTAEAEAVVSHPVRRQIAVMLMWLGNVGIVSVLGSVVLSFGGDGTTLGRVAIIVGGLVVLTLLSRSRPAERMLNSLIERLLLRFTAVDARDYAGLLHVRGGWTIDELVVEPQDWLASRPLDELRLSEEGVLVLGIERADGEYVGMPRGEDVLAPDDRLVLYGQRSRIAELDERRRDDEEAHRRAVTAAGRSAGTSGTPGGTAAAGS